MGLCALLSLASCADSPPLIKSEPVEIPVPVLKPWPAELLKDCQPNYYYPPNNMSVEAIIDRLMAVELCLAVTRNQLEVMRAKQ